MDAIVEAAGVAKGTFYYHFQSVEELVAAVGAKLADSFDELLAPSRLDEPDPIVRMSLAFTKFLEKAINDPLWGRLVVRSAQVPAGLDRIRENLKADLAEAIAQGRLAIKDVELAADIVIGIWLQVTRGSLERRPRRTSPAKLSTPCCEPLVCRSHAIATGRRQDRRRQFKVSVRTITSGTQTMNNAYISALAALAGSGIGALASVGTTWLTQRYQDRSQRSAQISARLEQLFGEFIDQASRVFADALTHQLDDLSKLVPLYATMGKLRLYASNATVLCADRVMSRNLGRLLQS